jgi:succinyl-CoA synthetase alpha subunit
MDKLKPDATGIYVAAHQAPGAIEEAVEAEVPLIVAVAEHIPIHDILRVRATTFEWTSKLLKIADTLHVENPVQVSTCRSQRSRYHIRDWEMQNRLPATSLFCTRPYRYRCKVRYSQLRR